MRVLAILMLVIFTLQPQAIAYPQEQLKECILGIKQSPITLGVPEKSIENLCDCALSSIIDKDKEMQSKLFNQCASKYLGWIVPFEIYPKRNERPINLWCN